MPGHALTGTRLRVGLAAAAALLWACAAASAIAAQHWPQISDAVLMHYVVFLLGKGFAPYRGIVDVNLPGSYAADWIAGLLFRGHWRVFDWTLTALAGAVFFKEGHRAGSLQAGFFAAALWTLWHLRDGAAQAGQRDYFAAVLLLLAYAALHIARDRQSLAWAFAFGLGCGTAAAIKPQAALFWFLLLPFLAARRRQRTAFTGAGAAGLLLPACVLALWLAREHALRAFLDAACGLMPYHAGMSRHPLGFLILHAIPWQLLPFLLLAFVLALHRGRPLYPANAALLGMLGGLLSFVLQGKAYPYHRYPLLAFTLLFFALELAAFVQVPASKPLRWAAFTVCLYAGLWFGPEAAARTARQDWRTTPALDALQADLARLGGPALENRVQCMDTMAGCITALDRMRLTQATGFLYDCYLFAPGASGIKEGLRRRFAEQMLNRPPAVFVVTDQWCFDADPEYRRLREWPWFTDWLGVHYRLEEQRRFSSGSKHLSTWPFGYRLYIWRG